MIGEPDKFYTKDEYLMMVAKKVNELEGRIEDLEAYRSGDEHRNQEAAWQAMGDDL